MVEYELTDDAAKDLVNIFDYTIDKWGIQQANLYKGKLISHFEGIGRGDVRSKSFLRNLPNILVSRCERHYVFHFVRPGRAPLIVAVFHERMDLVNRVRKRLED